MVETEHEYGSMKFHFDPVQFGDGFSNILIPTQYVLIGILAMAGIPYDRWLRFIMPFMVKVAIVGSIALVVAVWIGYA